MTPPACSAILGAAHAIPRHAGGVRRPVAAARPYRGRRQHHVPLPAADTPGVGVGPSATPIAEYAAANPVRQVG